MRELHLFAGVGGGILGGMLLEHECVCAVEIDPYCQEVLRARQEEGVLPRFPIHGDVRLFSGLPWRGKVDVVCGGFPCQPWSTAGKRLGESDPRHLWPEMCRVIGECRPRFAFLENVSLDAFREPWRDLRGLGYRVPPALKLGAWQLGAPFQRDRWWLLAADLDHANEHVVPVDAEVAGVCEAGDADGAGLEVWGGWAEDARASLAGIAASERAAWRQLEPRLRRLVSRVPARVESRQARIRASGNAQVPQVAAAAFRTLMRHFC